MTTTELKELWIGDFIKVLASNQIGRFTGIAPDMKARVELKGHILEFEASEIILVDDPQVEIEEEEQFQKKTPKIEPIQFNSLESIDLHIEKLSSNHTTLRAERILDIQMNAFKEHFENCILQKSSETEVIHGKGTGVLKNEIHSLLKYHPDVFTYSLIHDGGATQIIFNKKY